jgi:tetratricopeptide (TPR) repeat protein
VHELLTEAVEGAIDEGIGTPTFVQIACPDTEGRVDKSAEVEYAERFQEWIEREAPDNLSLVVRHVENNEDFIPPLRLKEGLRELFRDYRLPEGYRVGGLADLTAYYAGLSERLGLEVDVPERVLASRADALSAAGSVEAATEVLDFLIDVYPASVDGYWRLANLHREGGDHEAALTYYRKCLELMPNMRPARDWIDRLEAGE